MLYLLIFQADEHNCLLFLYLKQLIFIFVACDRGNPLLGARQMLNYTPSLRIVHDYVLHDTSNNRLAIVIIPFNSLIFSRQETGTIEKSPES